MRRRCGKVAVVKLRKVRVERSSKVELQIESKVFAVSYRNHVEAAVLIEGDRFLAFLDTCKGSTVA